MPRLVIVADAGGDLHDNRGGEYACPAHAESAFGKAITLCKESGGLCTGGYRVAILLRQPGLPTHEEPVFIGRNHIDLEELAALGVVQNFLDLVIVIPAGDRAIREVRKGECVQKSDPIRMEAALRDYIARELRECRVILD